jgi:hypothetical protein
VNGDTYLLLVVIAQMWREFDRREFRLRADLNRNTLALRELAAALRKRK